MLKNLLLRHWISRSRAIGVISRSPNHYNYNSTGSFRSLYSACAASRDSPTISHKPFVSPPWPMLPPALGAAAEIVGCSHGWVAVFDNNALFLTDPLSHRRINLPPIHTLPDPEFYLDLDGRGIVNKVILSSSPDADECRAVMTFGSGNRLAFCLPGRSSGWTPLGEAVFYYDGDFPLLSVAKVHEDVVYCARRRLFTSMTAFFIDFDSAPSRPHLEGVEARRMPEIYDWDIGDPDSPLTVGEHWLVSDAHDDRWLAEKSEVLRDECVQIPHLVYAEESDQIFVVVQFVRLVDPDSGAPLGHVPGCEVKGVSGVFPGKTFGFLAMKMRDLEPGEVHCERLCVAVEDLDGMSMFVGINHAFAVRISDRDGLFKPNCIYFGDAKRLGMVSCAGDTGVFDYATKTVSPLDHHHHLLTGASPFWFT